MNNMIGLGHNQWSPPFNFSPRQVGWGPFDHEGQRCDTKSGPKSLRFQTSLISDSQKKFNKKMKAKAPYTCKKELPNQGQNFSGEAYHSKVNFSDQRISRNKVHKSKGYGKPPKQSRSKKDTLSYTYNSFQGRPKRRNLNLDKAYNTNTPSTGKPIQEFNGRQFSDKSTVTRPKPTSHEISHPNQIRKQKQHINSFVGKNHHLYPLQIKKKITGPDVNLKSGQFIPHDNLSLKIRLHQTSFNKNFRHNEYDQNNTSPLRSKNRNNRDYQFTKSPNYPITHQGFNPNNIPPEGIWNTQENQSHVNNNASFLLNKLLPNVSHKNFMWNNDWPEISKRTKGLTEFHYGSKEPDPQSKKHQLCRYNQYHYGDAWMLIHVPREHNSKFTFKCSDKESNGLAFDPNCNSNDRRFTRGAKQGGIGQGRQHKHNSQKIGFKYSKFRKKNDKRSQPDVEKEGDNRLTTRKQLNHNKSKQIGWTDMGMEWMRGDFRAQRNTDSNANGWISETGNPSNQFAYYNAKGKKPIKVSLVTCETRNERILKPRRKGQIRNQENQFNSECFGYSQNTKFERTSGQLLEEGFRGDDLFHPNTLEGERRDKRGILNQSQKKESGDYHQFFLKQHL